MDRLAQKILWLSLTTTACIGPFASDEPCSGTGFPGVAVAVRDDFGRPAGIGTKLVARDGAFADSATETANRFGVGAAENRAGTYSLRVSRPWYQDVNIARVHVPGDHCGAKATVTVPVTVHLLPGAPSIRNVVVIPAGAYMDLGGLALQYGAYVDGDPGVDTAVTWTIDDTTFASLSRTGRLVTKCLTHYGDVVVTASSSVDPTVRGHGYLRVGADFRGC